MGNAFVHLFSSNEKGVDTVNALTIAAFLAFLVATGWVLFNDFHLFNAWDFAKSSLFIVGGGGLAKGGREWMTPTPEPVEKPQGG